MAGTASLVRAITALSTEDPQASLTVRLPGVATGVTVWAQGFTVTLPVDGLSGLQKVRARSAYAALGAHPYHVDQMTNAGRMEHGFPDAAKAANAVAILFEKVLGKAVGDDLVIERHA